jgi:hypothetical protein
VEFNMADRMTASVRPAGSSADLPWGRDWPIVILLWLLVTAAMLYGYWGPIADLQLADPDDALRLVQVRDLLAGQAWYDLTQYRINPAQGGGDLHWSRFIDLQLAAMIRLFELVLPPVEAERWAVALYPPLLVLLVLLIFQRLLAHLGDRQFVLAGLFVAATTYSFLHYFTPLRIDHHGWQLVMSLAMLWLALGPASMARGLAAAMVIGMHVEISLEGLPYLVIFGGLFALDWLRRPETAPRLLGFAIGLIFLPLLWILLLRGGDAVMGVYCDAFSRPYLAGAAITGAMLAVAMTQQRWTATWVQRAAALGIAGLLGGGIFALSGPACLTGPFGNLSPLVREFWYEGISEGHPIWDQPPLTLVSFILPSLIGLVGIGWSWWQLRGTPRAENWLRLGLVALGSFVLSLLVLRATAVTHAYVVPGYVMAFLAIFRWGRGFGSSLARVPATAACIIALPLTVSALTVGLMSQFAPEPRGEMPTDCLTPQAVARLTTLPPTTIFAALDFSPAILAGTSHSVVASGHHRNHRAIHRVLEAFMAPEAKAERLIRETGATMVAVCRNLPEYHNFVKHGRGGLAAMLDAGTPPPWLKLDAARSVGPLLLYRITPE